MLICLYLVALLPLPTWEYKIKVEGKLDIGNQIADFLRDLRSRITDQRLRALRQGHKDDGYKRMQNIYAPPTTKQNIVRTNIPLIEEAINNGQGRMHVYGTHRQEKKKDRNNVQI